MSVRFWFKFGDRAKTSIDLGSEDVVDNVIEKALQKVKESAIDPTTVIAFFYIDGQRKEFNYDTKVVDLGEIGINSMMPLLLEIGMFVCFTSRLTS